MMHYEFKNTTVAQQGDHKPIIEYLNHKPWGNIKSVISLQGIFSEGWGELTEKLQM